MITPEELDPFVPHVMENLEDKNVDLVVSCLKFLSSATTNRSVCQYLLTRHKQEADEDFKGEQGRDKMKSFLFVVTKKCRQYHPMRNREPYNAICMVRTIVHHCKRKRINVLDSAISGNKTILTFSLPDSAQPVD